MKVLDGGRNFLPGDQSIMVACPEGCVRVILPLQPRWRAGCHTPPAFVGRWPGTLS